MRILFDANALETTDERLFPESRHRSARIRKKLIKRHGGEFRRVPAMFRYGETIVAHPSLKAAIERATRPASAAPAPAAGIAT
jgi:hypothetical protein